MYLRIYRPLTAWEKCPYTDCLGAPDFTRCRRSSAPSSAFLVSDLDGQILGRHGACRLDLPMRDMVSGKQHQGSATADYVKQCKHPTHARENSHAFDLLFLTGCFFHSCFLPSALSITATRFALLFCLADWIGSSRLFGKRVSPSSPSDSATRTKVCNAILLLLDSVSVPISVTI